MLLKGSCHCGKISFSVESHYSYPFNLCYCSICRKTAGGGGYAINLSGDNETLSVRGKKHLAFYRAKIKNKDTGRRNTSSGRRHFCKHCGSFLWLWDPSWPELMHPFASAIDSKLPVPPERTHLMLGSKASWVPLCAGKKDKKFKEYPKESIADWHERLGKVVR